MELFDLTVPLSPELEVLPGDPPVTVERTASHETHGFEVARISMGSHSGTHVEAPRHFYPNGLTLDAFPLRRFIGPGVVLDCRSLETLAGQLREWPLAEHGLALLWMDGAPLTLDAAEMLAAAGAGLVGTDAPSIDDEPYHVHRFLLARDILIAENLANLGRLGPGPALCALLPLSFKGTDAAPMRAIAWR